jgi:hypothetical protein
MSLLVAMVCDEVVGLPHPAAICAEFAPSRLRNSSSLPTKVCHTFPHALQVRRYSLTIYSPSMQT